MPEPKATPLEKTDHRPTMHKRLEVKEDGRTLIYYTFDDAAAVEKSNRRAVEKSNSGAAEESNRGAVEESNSGAANESNRGAVKKSNIGADKP